MNQQVLVMVATEQERPTVQGQHLNANIEITPRLGVGRVAEWQADPTTKVPATGA